MATSQAESEALSPSPIQSVDCERDNGRGHGGHLPVSGSDNERGEIPHILEKYIFLPTKRDMEDMFQESGR